MHRVIHKVGLVVLVIGLGVGCDAPETPDGALSVEFSEIKGVWFDIAHLPNELQEDCRNTTVLHSAVTEQAMPFVYECFRWGWWENYSGLATLDVDYPRLVQLHFDDDPSGLVAPTRYWLLARGEDGSWIAVGEPQEESLWIYARTFRVESQQIEDIKQRLVERGYFSSRYLNRELALTSHQ